jgi:branched-chain amino acid aminotransferase
MEQLVYVDGAWHTDNHAVMGPITQSVWMATAVFEGMRSFRGTAPDVDRHSERLITSAHVMGLKPMLTAREVYDLVWEGIERFPKETELYIRPMFYAEGGFVVLDPETTRFTITFLDRPMQKPTGFSACLARWRRPAPDMAPTDAKAACLYPNAARAIREANDKGFTTAVMLDPNSHVAEFATANLFIVRDGVVQTPVHNRTFLNGITRRRVIQLLRDDGMKVEEGSLTFDDVMKADEVFSTGNLDKVLPTTRVEDRHLQPGPITMRARDLYFEWSKAQVRK